MNAHARSMFRSVPQEADDDVVTGAIALAHFRPIPNFHDFPFGIGSRGAGDTYADLMSNRDLVRDLRAFADLAVAGPHACFADIRTTFRDPKSQLQWQRPCWLGAAVEFWPAQLFRLLDHEYEWWMGHDFLLPWARIDAAGYGGLANFFPERLNQHTVLLPLTPNRFERKATPEYRETLSSFFYRLAAGLKETHT